MANRSRHECLLLGRSNRGRRCVRKTPWRELFARLEGRRLHNDLPLTTNTYG